MAEAFRRINIKQCSPATFKVLRANVDNAFITEPWLF